jgi:hypothetical protein
MLYCASRMGATADMAMVRLDEFEAEWGKVIGQAWRPVWEQVIPFFAFAPGIRKMMYTTKRSRGPGIVACAKSSRPAVAFPKMMLHCTEAPLPRHQELRHALAAKH